MQYIKLKTSDEDVRWVNLEQVSRVTLGADKSGEQILVIIFADGNVENSLKIRGSDEINQSAIEKLVGTLDALCGSLENGAAS